MRLLFILMCISFWGCKQQPKDTNPVLGGAIIAIQNSLEVKLGWLEKRYNDNPNNSIYKEIYTKSSLVHSLCKLADSMFLHQDLCLFNEHLRQHNNNLLNAYEERTKQILVDYTRIIPSLTKPKSNSIDEYRIAMLCHNLNIITNLINVTYDCWAIPNYKLISTPENKQIKLGEPFRCMNVFEESNVLAADSEPTITIKKVTRNNKPYWPKQMTNKFNNGYIEFTPEQLGNYIIFLEKKRIRKSGKVETYETQVNFVVTP